MSQKRPQYRHSWKKPWLFKGIHEMRQTVTEREMYKKLKLLERHSSYKKPYYNFETHQHGELRYSWPRFRPGDRPGGGAWVPPTGGTGEEGYGGCAMACNGGMLDCEEGGCDTITCICAEPPLYGTIVEDPTGSASILGQGSAQLQVCIEPQKTNETYDEVVVHVLDSRGYQALTRHPLVDCNECCDSFSLTGANTVNPDSNVVLTVSPCCTGIEITVAATCGSVNSSTSPDGCKVTVSVGAAACGEITVTATYTAENCTTRTATKYIRINNTGQGGAWNDWTACCDDANYCNTCCDGSQDCDVGGCDGWVSSSSSIITETDNGWKRLGRGGPLDPDCSEDIECRPCNTGGPTNEGCTPQGGCSGACGSDYEYIWGYSVCTWRCSC